MRQAGFAAGSSNPAHDFRKRRPLGASIAGFSLCQIAAERIGGRGSVTARHQCCGKVRTGGDAGLGVLLTPFHNMMLLSPQTAPAAVDRLLAHLEAALEELAR